MNIKLRRTLAWIGVACLSFSAPALSDDYSDAVTAWQNGDFKLALEKFLPLANSGGIVAQTMVGQMYEYGQGIAEDKTEAVKWYRLAAEQGDANAQLLMGGM